jgi:cobalt-zinc-cadmium efflux system membrane fusion protein
VKCHPEMAAVFKASGDWCSEHGVPESQCFDCSPELIFEKPAENAALADWCKEHAVPESKCTKCHPNLIAKFIEAGDYCREHGFPESVCPICHPQLPKKVGQPAPAFPEPGTTVTLASAETVNDVGIGTARVEKRPFSQTIEVSGQLEFNGNAHAQVSSRGEARVLEVLVDVGDTVKKGQALVVLASAEVGADRASLATARARLESANSAVARLAQLEGITARKSIDEAKREQAEAQAAHDGALAALSVSGADIAMSSGGRLVLSSPLAGIVVGRDAVPGRVASAGDVLVEVADTKTLWATLEVPESDSTYVKPGQKVELGFDGVADELRGGVIAKVAARVDAHTRTVRARVDLDNADGSLKAGLFLKAAIAVADEHEAILVPKAAVQRAEGRAVVFVVKKHGVYEPVAVELGAKAGDAVEVVSGLSPGDEVVTTGAFLLKTELLKGSIGAGCCGE